MNAARRAYENDTIILQILGYLDRPTLRRIVTLDFFQLAIRVLWRRIWVSELYSLLDGSVGQGVVSVLMLVMPATLSRIWIRRQTHIVADYRPSPIHEAYTTEESVASHRKSCPGLISYSLDTLVTFPVPRWKITFYPGRGGIIHHTYDTVFCIGDDFDLESPPPEPVWEGYRTTCTAGMTFTGDFASGDPLAPTYIQWLLSGRLDPRVVRLS